MDIRPQPTSRQPFAAVDLFPGVALNNTMIEWRSVPVGLLPPLDDPQGVVLRPVTAGEPLVPSILSTRRIPAPEGWWTMEIRLPVGAVPGQAVQLILLPTGLEEEPRSVPGLVIVPPPTDQDPLAIEPAPGLVAVPAEWAALAAAAVVESSVAVILGADSG
jgi:hypothetical protein